MQRDGWAGKWVVKTVRFFKVMTQFDWLPLPRLLWLVSHVIPRHSGG
jgi:hypothetical protein